MLDEYLSTALNVSADLKPSNGSQWAHVFLCFVGCKFHLMTNPEFNWVAGLKNTSQTDGLIRCNGFRRLYRVNSACAVKRLAGIP